MNDSKKERTNNFRRLREIQDDELATKAGLVRVGGGEYVVAETITGFTVQGSAADGEAALTIKIYGGGCRRIESSDSNRVMGLLLEAFSV